MAIGNVVGIAAARTVFGGFVGVVAALRIGRQDESSRGSRRRFGQVVNYKVPFFGCFSDRAQSRWWSNFNKNRDWHSAVRYCIASQSQGPTASLRPLTLAARQILACCDGLASTRKRGKACMCQWFRMWLFSELAEALEKRPVCLKARGHVGVDDTSSAAVCMSHEQRLKRAWMRHTNGGRRWIKQVTSDGESG